MVFLSFIISEFCCIVESREMLHMTPEMSKARNKQPGLTTGPRTAARLAVSHPALKLL